MAVDRLRRAFSAYPPARYLLALLLIPALVLVWQTRNGALVLGSLRFDALGAAFALFAAGAPLLAVGQGPTLRGLMIVVALLAASLGTTPQITAWFLFIAALSGSGRGQIQRVAASLVLLAAGGVLATRGAGDLAVRVPPGALDTSVFALTLAGTIIGLFAPTEQSGTWRATRAIWLLPLLRLFSYGAWEITWIGAAAALGALGAAASGVRAWHSGSAHDAWRVVPWCGVAAAGVASSMGVAAVIMVLAADALGAAIGRRAPPPWALLGAPALAVWGTCGALSAGGLAPLCGPLLLGVGLATMVLLAQPTDAPPRWLVGGSLAWLVLAPVLLRELAQPAVEQVQAGLSVYGELALLRRVGLVALDSARREIFAVPVLLVAAIVAVLWALIRIARVGLTERDSAPALPSAASAPPRGLNGRGVGGEGDRTTRPNLRAAIAARLPWLGGRDDQR